MSPQAYAKPRSRSRITQNVSVLKARGLLILSV
jgi:hypothetical protein